MLNKNALLFVLLQLAWLATYSQSSLSLTYTQGDLPTDRDFTALPGFSIFPGLLSFDLPLGAYITAVDVAYNMTAQNVGEMGDQRSWLYSPTSQTGESSIAHGSGTLEGTYIYNRTGLTFANGMTNTVEFELHAGRT